MTRRPRGYWNSFEHVGEELRAWIAAHGAPGVMPSSEELRIAGATSLLAAIGEHGGRSAVALRLGLSIHGAGQRVKRPNGYWQSFANLEHELLAWIQVHGQPGVMPPQLSLQRSGASALAAAMTKHGGFAAVAERLGLTWNKSGTAWSAEERERFEEGLDRGEHFSAIAADLPGRPATAIQRRTKRHGYSITTSPTTMSGRGMARLLGFKDVMHVGRWVAAGLLQASNAAPAGSRPLYRITWDALIAFLEDETTWMLWDPERISDEQIRDWAKTLRAQGPVWLDTTLVAARFPSTTAKQAISWCRYGFLPAVIRGGQYWVREQDIQCFRPPSAAELARAKTQGTGQVARPGATGIRKQGE